MTVDIDLPDVLAEVRFEFDRYEQALIANDVATLDAIFHEDPRTIRYGGGENLYGFHEIEAFRSARSPAGLMRTLSRTTCDFDAVATCVPRVTVTAPSTGSSPTGSL